MMFGTIFSNLSAVFLLLLLAGCGGGGGGATADRNDSNTSQPDDFNATKITTFDRAVSAFLATKEYAWNGELSEMTALTSGIYAPVYWTVISAQLLATDTDKICQNGGDVALYRTDRIDGKVDMKLSFVNCRIPLNSETDTQLFGSVILNGLDENLSISGISSSEFDQFSASFTDKNGMLTGKRIELNGSSGGDFMFKGSFTRYTAMGKGVRYTRVEIKDDQSLSLRLAVEHFPDTCARDGRYRVTYSDIDGLEIVGTYLFSKGTETINGVEYRFFSNGTTYSVGITIGNKYRVFDQKTLGDGCASTFIDLPGDLNIGIDLPHQITFR